MADETAEYGNLIGSDKVEGTTVYGANGESVGSIERVMIDKKTGKVSFAVLSFGGFLGIGNDHYPLSWNALTYNTDLGGYQTSLTQEQLRGAPKYEHEGDWDWNDPERPSAVESYYSGLWGTRRLDERP
ncbi:photosystem reaction center subunit H [Labrys miyagiensis]|uniref:Photosystem reaction center subunit H n=1 Tax=Labrys miyagiensis TaxID=346912 RepID=A0ABQ6CL15_9HYPH|nr:PRC-barrel domain-containing protein [Labrys miyagiensis]GLS20986.1 photosystem reaction center subunit H [Labrys miyagiensis]